MPNWCVNLLVIKGEPDDLKAFVKDAGAEDEETVEEFFKRKERTLRSWLKMPQTFIDWDTTNDKLPENAFPTKEEYEKYSEGYDKAVEEQQKEFGVVGWKEYNLLTLGCKWDCEFEQVVVPDDKTIEINFSSPWVPPTKGIITLIKSYPNLSFSMKSEECGSGCDWILEGSHREVTTNLYRHYEEYNM